MSPRYRHRKSRPLHDVRHGWNHYTLHRDGIRHRHGDGVKFDRAERATRQWSDVPRRLWPREIGKQIALGVLAGAGVMLLVCLVFGTIAFLDARSDLSKAQNIGKNLVTQRDQLLTSTGRSTATINLEQMHYYADAADAQLSNSWAISVLKLVPIFGHQVSSLTQTVHDVNALSNEGVKLINIADNAVAESHGTSISLPAVAALDDQVHASAHVIRGLYVSPDGLWGPVRTERLKLNAEVTIVANLLDRGGYALDFAQPFLGSQGPRTYFVAGENNSEMRDQGAVLSWALLRVNNGDFTMDSAASVGTITLSHPAATISDPTTAAVFGPFNPTQIWQSVNAVGDFPTSARWMIDMFHQARGIHVDGVIGVDVQTLQAILNVTGGVHVPAIHREVTTNNVASLLLYDLYKRYPYGSQKARHDEVTAVAQAAIHKMKQGNYDLGAFLHALAKSSQGRHLLFYDTDPTLQRTVVSFGGAGGMQDYGRNAIHLAMEAGAAAKVDWFMYSDCTDNVQIDAQGNAYITTTLQLHNTAPAGQGPSYALGSRTHGHTPGEYDARLFLWMPRATQAPGALTEEGLSLQRAISFVYPQQTQQVVWTSFIPNAVHHGRFTLHFIPQSLIHPTAMTVNFTSADNFNGPPVTTWSATHAVTLTWTSSQ